MRFCNECGAQLWAKARLCGQCGERVDEGGPGSDVEPPASWRVPSVRAGGVASADVLTAAFAGSESAVQARFG